MKGDLTKQNDVDVIVSSVSADLDCSGKLNCALVKAAGEQLDDFILEHIFKPRQGDVFAVPSFNLPVAHIIFAVTPDWGDGFNREDRDLLRCYRRSIKLAKRMDAKKIAFPALGTGERAYPLPRAARLAVQGIMERIDSSLEEVRIVCDRDETYEVFLERLKRKGWSGAG